MKKLLPVAVLTLAATLTAAPSYAVHNFQGLAHQGAHDGLPGQFSFELDNNTLPAFAAATAHGFINETDLRISSDEVFYMIHEDLLGVNSDCHGYVADTTAAVIETCRTDHGYPLPTFDETVTSVVQDGGVITVEVKKDPRIDADPVHYVQRMVDVIRAHHAEDNVWLEATGVKYLKAFAKVAPELKVAWKLGSVTPTGADAVRYSVDVVLLPPTATAEKLQDMKAHGQVVYSRRTKTVSAWNRLEAAGFDGTLTDFAPEFAAWRDAG